MRQAPALVITIPLEGQPRVDFVAMSETDEARIRDWTSRPGFKAVIDAALDLRDEALPEL